MDIFSGCNVEGEYCTKLVYFITNKKYILQLQTHQLNTKFGKFSGCNIKEQYRIKLVHFILNKKYILRLQTRQLNQFSGCNVEGEYRIKLVYFITNKKIFCIYKHASLTFFQVVTSKGNTGHNVEYVLRLADWIRDQLPEVRVRTASGLNPGPSVMKYFTAVSYQFSL